MTTLCHCILLYLPVIVVCSCNSDYYPPPFGATTGGDVDYDSVGDAGQDVACSLPGSMAIDEERALYGCYGSWNFGFYFAYTGQGFDWDFNDDAQGIQGFGPMFFCVEPPAAGDPSQCRFLLAGAGVAPDGDRQHDVVQSRACCANIGTTSNVGASPEILDVVYDACTFDFVVNMCRALPLRLDAFFRGLSVVERIALKAVDGGALWSQMNHLRSYLRTSDAQNECLTSIAPSLRARMQGDWHVGDEKLPNMNFDPSVNWPLLTTPRYSVHVESVGGTFTAYAIHSWSEIATSCAVQSHGVGPPPDDTPLPYAGVFSETISLSAPSGEIELDVVGGQLFSRFEPCGGDFCLSLVDALTFSVAPIHLGVLSLDGIEGRADRAIASVYTNGGIIPIEDAGVVMQFTARATLFGLIPPGGLGLSLDVYIPEPVSRIVNHQGRQSGAPAVILRGGLAR